MRGKRGWIRIVEAFVAVLLITGVVLIIINKGYIGKEDISEKVYTAQLAVLREIEMDSDLRVAVLGADVNSEGDYVPENVKNKISNRIPDYLKCASKICGLNELCELSVLPSEAEGKDIYAQPITIAVEPGQTIEFDPRQLKLFCWVK